MNETNIMRYSRRELDEMRRAGTTGTDWDRIAAMTEEEIEHLAIEENNRLGIADDWYTELDESASIFDVAAEHGIAFVPLTTFAHTIVRSSTHFYRLRASANSSALASNSTHMAL